MVVLNSEREGISVPGGTGGLQGVDQTLTRPFGSPPRPIMGVWLGTACTLPTAPLPLDDHHADDTRAAVDPYRRPHKPRLDGHVGQLPADPPG